MGRILKTGHSVKTVSGAGAPADAPDYKGQIAINTDDGTVYYAKDTTAATDWVPVMTGSGEPIFYNATLARYRKSTLTGADGNENLTFTDL